MRTKFRKGKSVNIAITAHLTDFPDLLFHQLSLQADYLAD